MTLPSCTCTKHFPASVGNQEVCWEAAGVLVTTAGHCRLQVSRVTQVLQKVGNEASISVVQKNKQLRQLQSFSCLWITKNCHRNICQKELLWQQNDPSLKDARALTFYVFVCVKSLDFNMFSKSFVEYTTSESSRCLPVCRSVESKPWNETRKEISRHLISHSSQQGPQGWRNGKKRSKDSTSLRGILQ